MTRRPPVVAVFAVFVVVAIIGTVVLANTLVGLIDPARSTGDAGTSPGASDLGANPDATPTPVPTPHPIPGHEVYGFVPYWEMDETIAAHLRATDLSTVALFSVTNKRNGTIDTGQNGYRKITGPIGRQVIREAHERKARVEFVYTSFGYDRNKRFFGGKLPAQDKVIASLVAFAEQTGVDGINVDVEMLDAEFVPAYAAFVGRLRTALQATEPKATVTVATTANIGGADMAAAAAQAGADRIFMMAYDYHWPGSAPGASSPIARRDGSEKDLVWSLDLYDTLGVPVDRTLLGLPLYGMRWPVTGPELGAPQTGRGVAWFPRNNVAFLHDRASVPTRDPIEMVELYAVDTVTGKVASPSVSEGTPDPSTFPGVSGTTAPSGSPGTWEAIYVDSPDTLAPKLALADDRGLAGAGFWAVGYERGVPGYTTLINRFRAGRLEGAGG
jgi:Glycosyl hydrolases family 18